MLVRRAKDGDRLVYEVRKPKRGSRWHRFDLEAFDGNGACDCEDFEYHKAKKLRARAALAKDVRRRLAPVTCVHAGPAFMQFARDQVRGIIDYLAEKHPNTSPAPHNQHE